MIVLYGNHVVEAYRLDRYYNGKSESFERVLLSKPIVWIGITTQEARSNDIGCRSLSFG